MSTRYQLKENISTSLFFLKVALVHFLTIVPISVVMVLFSENQPLVFELVKLTIPLLSMVLVSMCVKHSVVLQMWAKERLPKWLSCFLSGADNSEVVQKENVVDHFDVMMNVWEAHQRR